MGQTPFSLLNQIAERNMDIWKGLQQGLMNGLANPPEKPSRPAPRARTARKAKSDARP